VFAQVDAPHGPILAAVREAAPVNSPRRLSKLFS
jgi:hypothetical protein